MGYVLYSLDWERFQQLVQHPSRDQLTALARLLRDGLADEEDEFDEGDPVAAWPRDKASLTRIVAERLARADWYGDLSTTGKNLWEGVIWDACMNCDKLDVGFRVESDGIDWDVIEQAWKHLGVVPNTVTGVALSAFGTRPYRYHPRPGPAMSREEFDRQEADKRSSLDTLGQVLDQLLEKVKQGQATPDQVMDELENHDGISGEHAKVIRDLLSDDDSGEESPEDAGGFDDFSPMHSMHPPAEVEQMLAELRSVAGALEATKDADVWRDYSEELLPALTRVVQDRRLLFVQVDT